MKIDGVEFTEGSKFLIKMPLSRWLRFQNWFRRKLRMKEKQHPENGIYEVTSGPWGD